MNKKILAIFLTLMMCLNVLPTIALADTELETTVSTITQEEPNTSSGNDLSLEKTDSDKDAIVSETSNETNEKENVEVQQNNPDIQEESTENTLLNQQQTGTVWDGNTLTKPETDENGVYQIANGENLAWFAGLVNGTLTDKTPQDKGAKAVLISDIILGNDTSENNWTPIGNSANQYVGTFDGEGHTVKGLKIDGDTVYLGLFGYIGSTGVVRNVVLTGNICTSKNYVGGITGWNAGTIENCCNKAKVTSTQSYAGGIAGNNIGNSSKYANITGCYNEGAVSGKLYVGGIAGQNKFANTSSCYNLGDISSTGNNTGGVAGYGHTGTVTNCYNLGKVTSTSTTNIGAVLGYKLSSSVLAQTYYLEGTNAIGIGNDATNKNAIVKTSDAMKKNEFVAELGGSFVADTNPNQNNGYPIVGWQDPHAKYIAAFKINEAQAQIEVKDSEGKLIAAEADGTYKLDKGNYSYVVSKDGFKTVKGTFSINNSGEAITVNLEVKTYEVVFEGINATDATLTVKNSKGETVEGNGFKYDLIKGSYSYTVEKFGYKTAEGTFDVTGTDLTIPKISLAETSRSTVTFDISYADNNSEADAFIAVKHGSDVQERKADGSYSLADGEYSYAIICTGYKTIMGDITVKGEGVHIQQRMDIRKVWSGTKEEPATIVKDGKIYYRIANGENLAWLCDYINSGNVTANAVVTGDIVLSNAEQDNKWTSIGSYSQRYAGIFDGQGHKISGLKGSNGLFAYSNVDSSIKNVVVEGIITEASSNVAGIMGVNYGSISNCSFRGSIDSTGQWVGGITGNNSGGTIENCVNYASIKVSTTSFNRELNSGGIAGKSTGSLKNCYNTGAITGYCPDPKCGELGGITGYSTGNIQNCYNVGVLTKEKDTMVKIGAISGNTSGNIGNCYFLNDSFPTGIGTGTGDAVVKTAAEIKDETFITILGDAFNQDYSGEKAVNSGYPVLKWQGGTEVSGNTNLKDVAADRNSLQLDQLVIQGQTRLNLPAAGEHGTSITWTSDNVDVITGDGEVKPPKSGNVKVVLTATITKGKFSDTKQFELTVKSLDETTKDYLDKANAELNNRLKVLSPVFGKDKNITAVVQNKLNDLGYSGITVALTDNVDERYIAANGDITYYYADPNASSVMNFGQVNKLKFTLTKDQQGANYVVNATIRWDRDKVIQTMTEQIADKITFDAIKGENTDINSITKNLILPQQLSEKAWATITWEPNESSVSIVKNTKELFGDFTGKVTRPQDDTSVKLKATITFNKTGNQSEEAPIIMTKEFNLVLQGDNSVDWPAYMQKQLNEKYTIDKLKDSTSKKIIDPENITSDIQLLAPGATGIEKSGNYKFTAASSDTDTIQINGYRANVYRPLPGEKAKKVTLTVSMQKKDTDIVVTKDFCVTVQPILQTEIDKEIALMERVKSNYAKGILGEMDSENVTGNLHAFQEAYLNERNELVWVYNKDDQTNSGIEPSKLPKEGYDESYNLFRSSKPEIIQHENLVLVPNPKEDTKVTITSNLQSIQFAKYAEKYPNDENFKKLINQMVETTVLVKGKGSDNPNPEKPETEVTVMIKSQADGKFLVTPQTVKVAYDLAENYGYTDLVKNHVSALDALVKEHELRYGKAFTKEKKDDFLQVGTNGYVSVIFKQQTGNNGFAVNGMTPNDGVYNEIYKANTAYTANQAKIKDNDLVDFFIYGDAAEYLDLYTWFEEGQEIEGAANVPFDVSLKGFCIAHDGMKDAEEIKKKTQNIAGAQLSLVDEKGVITPIKNAVTDTNGRATLTLQAGTYYITATRVGATPILLPLSKVVVESGDSLTEKKNTAVKELNNYKNSSDYRTAQKQELEAAITKGTAAINSAVSSDSIQAALSQAKKEIDCIKTDTQLTIEEKIANEQKAYDAIYESLKNYKGGEPSNIIISIPYSGTENEIQQNIVNLYLNVLFEHPELFYVRTEYQMELEGNSAVITPFIIEQFKDKDSLNAKKATLQEVVNVAVESCTTSDMTDLEKLLALHDWLVNHCQYNKSGHKDGKADTQEAYTAYGALVDADAVCQGYSMALNLLLQKAGVTSSYVSGNGHSWNVVKISGNWYHVDSTWADETPDRPGAVKHNHFLLSDNEIKDENYHSKWSTRYDIKCSQAYEGDSPWKASTLPFIYDSKEKAFFNVKNQDGVTQYRKITFDTDGKAEEKVLQNIDVKNIRSQIEHKGILYLVDNTSIVYAYDIKNKVKKVLLDELIGLDAGYGILRRGEKLIVRANYTDVKELELYKEEPISTEVNKPSKVVTFMPAPGQFINKTEMLYNAYPNPEVTLENPLSEKVVSLGAYGGYIVYEFDKPITNNPNNPYGIDFIVYGNSNNKSDEGNSEPGAVVVSDDGENWYELAGSEYYNADTRKNLEIIYTNPDPSFKEAVNIPWTTSDKKTGYVFKNNSHKQAYYPNPENYNAYNKGIAANSKYSDVSLSYVGNLINSEKTSFGYADSHKTGKNNTAVNPYESSAGNNNGDGMDLDWAIDKEGNPVKIDRVKFVKIYTAVLQDNGVMGESSSEVAGIFSAQGKEAAVGKTDCLKELKINDKSIALTDGQFTYAYDAEDSRSLLITATGANTDNIFINNKRVKSGTCSEPMALADKVRIIVQNGEKEPVLYIVNITGKNIGNNPDVKLTNYIEDLMITKLPDKTVYKLGESFDTTGMVVTAKYISDGKRVLKDINLSGCTIDGFNSKTAGAQNVNVSYYEDYYDDNHNFIKRINTSAIFVVNVKDDKTESPIEKEQAVTLTIKGAYGKTWTSNSYVINPGVTSVMDALKGVLALNGTTYTIKAGGKYISSIDGLGEFDLGQNSGWMVKVNDYLIDVSAADWKLKGGEKVLWFYTEDWTKVSGTKGWKKEEKIEKENTVTQENKTVTATVKAEAKTNAQGKASASIGTATVSEAISKVLKEAESTKKQGITANKEIVLEVKSDPAASSVETSIPKSAITELNSKVDSLKLATSIGEITFDNKAFQNLAKQQAGDLKLTVSRKDVESVIADAKNISDYAKEKIKNGEIFELTATSGTKTISQIEGNVIIKLPYKKPEDKKNEAIVAYEITSEGLMKPVIGGKLENDDMKFKITANHFSTYVIMCNDVNFADTQNHWADKNITYLAAREVIKGMTESTFEPNSNISRGQFVQILANMSGADLSKYADSKFKDVTKEAWYAKAAAWAADAGLVTGNVRNDGTVSFNANDSITRQDMAVILSRYMSKIEQKKLGEANKEVNFVDKSQIGSYATSAVMELQKAGIINGKTADHFAPTENATRAECSKMISVLIQNYL